MRRAGDAGPLPRLLRPAPLPPCLPPAAPRYSADSPARTRGPKAPAEKTSKRGVCLTDAVWGRHQPEAIRKRTTVSAIAGDVLERNPPRLRIEREA
jgi:hypothetical protein